MANCNQPLADMLELLREEQGESQISQQEDRQNQCNRGDQVNLHGLLPQLLACLDVEKRQDEKNYGEQHHQCVLHAGSPLLRPVQRRKWFEEEIQSDIKKLTYARLSAPERTTSARLESTGLA